MDARPLITCRQLIEFIAAYEDGELDATSRAEFERHLDRCRSCLAYLQSYRQTTDLTRALATDEVVDDVPEDLVRTILGARRP